ncbi:MAG: LysM peptidoglycan-binding domain-containing M23 family metallopeptidase [Bellilinea sp.]
MKRKSFFLLVMILSLTACLPQVELNDSGEDFSSIVLPATPGEEGLPTPLPTRGPYAPGTLVDYTAQTGDTLPALAAHFNTTIREILEANPFIPPDATTMPPGMPMKIPIYYRPLWGSPFQILPDPLFINGPAQIEFDAISFVNQQPGWFKDYSFYLGKQDRRGGEMIQYVATEYSISPRLLLAIIEYQTGALSQPQPAVNIELYPLGYANQFSKGLARQLLWAANTLNNGYYGWRTGRLDTIRHVDGRLENPDPWQNAASVALHYYFAQILPQEAYEYAISGEGLLRVYTELFGDPWIGVEPHIPGSLVQPEMSFPFPAGKTWAFTGGPHTGWGEGEPLAALDFAPPSVVGACRPSEQPAVAVADGVIARRGDALVVLDLDGDGDERTGWTVFYLHLANDSLPPVGKRLRKGEPIGLPSCEGGKATGTHVHIARKYNGEWIPAYGALPFNLEGWVAASGDQPYQGTLSRAGRTVRACECSDRSSQVQSQP